MANTQKLSPAGYIINNEPYNTNPFFTFDTPDIPNLESRLQEIEKDIEDLETDVGQNTLNINDLQDDVNHILSVDIVDLSAQVEKNTQDIATINEDLNGVLNELEGI